MKFAGSQQWRATPETESPLSNPTTYDECVRYGNPVMLSQTDLAQGYLDLNPNGRKDLLAYGGFTRALFGLVAGAPRLYDGRRGPNPMTRREMVQGLGGLAAATVTPPARANDSRPLNGFNLGVCSYSLREFQRKLAISMIQQLGVSYVSVKEFHMPYRSTPGEIVKAKSDFQQAGLKIASGGNIDLKDEDPRMLRPYFEYARACGMPMMVCAPTHKTLPVVENLAREFDIKMAIHTHGPEDPHFPTPQVVLQAVKDMDPRMGLCMDAGHSMRGGADVVEEIANAGLRLLDMHFKDLKNRKDKESQCDVGEGVMPVVAIFRQLRKIRYRGCVNLEYEINSDNPLPGMLHSMGYMKGVLAGLEA